MQGLNVHIEHLEPCHVASVTVKSESAEEDAIHALVDWARPQGLLERPFRFFGYDNCEPYPNHIYTAWLSVDSSTAPSEGIEIKEFPGGSFATIEVHGVEQISSRWKELAKWCEDHHYQCGDQPGLEEYADLLSDLPPNEWHFKLYHSIKE